MKTSISSKAFVALPTDIIDAHLWGESAQKKVGTSEGIWLLNIMVYKFILFFAKAL